MKAELYKYHSDEHYSFLAENSIDLFKVEYLPVLPIPFIEKHTVPSDFMLFPKKSCLKVKFNHFSFVFACFVELTKNLGKMRFCEGL